MTSMSLTDAQRLWFTRLRWAALAVLVGVAASNLLTESGTELSPIAALIVGYVVSNALFARSKQLTRRLVSLAVLMDVWWLTLVLYFVGGPTNPFTALYFVHVTVAAVLLGGPMTAAAWLNTVIAYGSTFAFMPPHAPHGFGSHLYGMFVAFALAAGLIALFVARLAAALQAREVALREAEGRAAQAARVASLTTLAAGAAHELGSPLGTIAVVAGELLRQTEGAQREDVALIQAEVKRCRVILDALSGDAGLAVGEGVSDVAVEALFDDVGARLDTDERGRLRCEGEGTVRLPRRAMAQLLHNLVRNAFDASEDGDRVWLRYSERTFEVEDEGVGMEADVLARAREPFFSTKPDPVHGQAAPGSGRGLGLFLAQTTAEAVGAALSIQSEPGQGTKAIVTLASNAEQQSMQGPERMNDEMTEGVR